MVISFPPAFHCPEEVIGQAQWPLEICVECSIKSSTGNELRAQGVRSWRNGFLNLKPGDCQECSLVKGTRFWEFLVVWWLEFQAFAAKGAGQGTK